MILFPPFTPNISPTTFLPPFPPSTQFDSQGNSGGCQRIYSVLASESMPTCDNSSLPDAPALLDVRATDDDGTLANDQNGPGEVSSWFFSWKLFVAGNNLVLTFARLMYGGRNELG